MLLRCVFIWHANVLAFAKQPQRYWIYRVSKVIRIYPEWSSSATECSGCIGAEGFRYLGLLFMSNSKTEDEAEPCLGALGAVMHASHRCWDMKQCSQFHLSFLLPLSPAVTASEVWDRCSCWSGFEAVGGRKGLVEMCVAMWWDVAT